MLSAVPVAVPGVRQPMEAEDVLVQLAEVVHSTLVVPLDGSASAV